MDLNTFLSFASAAVVLIFAALVLQRYLRRESPYFLLWAIGLVMYGVSNASQTYISAFGWSPLAFRIWYLFGAILVAAYLGQGTVYLLVRRRLGGVHVAHLLMVVLLLGSTYATYKVLSADLDPSQLSSDTLSGHAIVTSGVRILTPFFNIYGTVTLVGGALYSSWLFWRKGVLRNRVIGNILIAVGALMPAFGGSLSRFGLTEYLYLSLLLGGIIMFIGFLRAGAHSREALKAPQGGQVQAG